MNVRLVTVLNMNIARMFTQTLNVSLFVTKKDRTETVFNLTVNSNLMVILSPDNLLQVILGDLSVYSQSRVQ